MTNETTRDTIIRTLCTTLTQTEEELAQAKAEIATLKQQIEGWRVECEIHERDEKELYRLQEAIRPLKTENIRLTAQRDQLQADNERLKTALTVSENSHRDTDAQCKDLFFENERLKKAAEDQVWSKAPGGYNADPSL